MQKARSLKRWRKLRHLCRPSFKLIGGKQGKRFSCVFPLGEYVISRLSKKCSAFFFPTHFTYEWQNNSTNIAEDGRARNWLLLFANLKLFHSPLAQTWTWKERHFAAQAVKIHQLICIGLNMSLMLFAGLLFMIFFTLCIQNVAFFVA